MSRRPGHRPDRRRRRKAADSRFVVTNIAGVPRWLLRSDLLRPRPRPKIGSRAHKAAPRLRPHLLQQRCPPNQFRLLIHTRRLLAAPHPARSRAQSVPSGATPQFDTIRLALIKVAARVTEMGPPAIKVALPSTPRRCSTETVKIGGLKQHS